MAAGEALLLLASLCPPAWLEPHTDTDADAVARWFSSVAVRLADLQQRDPALLDAERAPPPPPPPDDDDDEEDHDKGGDGVGGQG